MPAVDMTKGVLVVTMVVYHSFNYSADYRLGFQYLPFLPPSFILITGFLIAKVYGRQEDWSRQGASGRLITRGLRLLVLFTLLNIAAQFTGRYNGALEERSSSFFHHWVEIYLTGTGRFAAFEVLVPIAYLLLAAPVLLWLRRSSKFFLPGVALLLLGGCELLSRLAEPYGMILLFSAGVIGMLAGGVSAAKLELAGRYWVITVLAYAGYVAVREYVEEDALAQLVDAFLATLLIYAICLRIGATGFLQERLITLGKYSLIAYVGQIAILQVFGRAFGRLIPFSLVFFGQMLLVLVLILVISEALQWARGKSRALDYVYRAGFA
ncbi:MAG: acyltransferase family protein [Chthoniobacterales bacterium]